jgi:hypothetical protein
VSSVDPVMTDQAYRSAKWCFVLLMLFPIWSLFLYIPASIAAFHYSEAFRHWVDRFPVHLSWLPEIFPVLHAFERALAHRASDFSLGFFYHVYAMALVVNAIAVIVLVLSWQWCRAVAMERLRRDSALRRRFDSRKSAAVWYARVCVGIIVIALFAHWLDAYIPDVEIYRWRRLLRITYLVVKIPALTGGPTMFFLGSLVALAATLGPGMRGLEWGRTAREK